MTDRDNLRFNVLRNALYHSARFRSLERINRFFNFVVLMLGASVIANVAGSLGLDQRWLGGAVAVVGSLQLVFDLGGAARDHQVLQRDYYYLLASIEELVSPTEVQLADFNAEMVRITGNEMPTLRAIDAKAYNDALDAQGIYDPKTERLIIPFFHSLTGWILPFEGVRYKKVNEV